jgi:hypothetical protein
MIHFQMILILVLILDNPRVFQAMSMMAMVVSAMAIIEVLSLVAAMNPMAIILVILTQNLIILTVILEAMVSAMVSVSAMAVLVLVLGSLVVYTFLASPQKTGGPSPYLFDQLSSRHILFSTNCNSNFLSYIYSFILFY